MTFSWEFDVFNGICNDFNNYFNGCLMVLHPVV